MLSAIKAKLKIDEKSEKSELETSVTLLS